MTPEESRAFWLKFWIVVGILFLGGAMFFAVASMIGGRS